MKNDSNELLNDLLADWHRWARGFQIVASHGTSAMFAGVRSSRQWDSENDVIDGTIRDQTMRAFDFHVNELDPLHRTALHIQARNLASGVHVWRSERLPKDREERYKLLGMARAALLARLSSAGIV